MLLASTSCTLESVEESEAAGELDRGGGADAQQLAVPVDAEFAPPEDWTFIGYGEICETCAPEYPVGDENSEDGEPEDEDGGPGVDPEPGSAKQSRKMIAFTVLTGEEYLIELPAATMDALAEAAKTNGSWFPDASQEAFENDPWLNSGEPVDDEHAEEFDGFAAETRTLPGWSNGVDTRKKRTDIGSVPYRAMGQINGGLNSGCSGTLVGPRHVSTAAHCLWNLDTQSWSPFTFRPGRAGTCAHLFCQPYGAHGAIWYFTPAEYRVPGQTQAYYNTHDYGFVVTQNRPGDVTGWLGMYAYTQSELPNKCDSLFSACWNRGYPACGFVENVFTPDGCDQGFPYQSEKRCGIGSFVGQNGPDGWRSQFKTGCDIGRGHSGGPAWTFFSGAPSDNVVVGIVITQDCTTCSSSHHYPNGFRRVTPDVTSWRQYFMNQFP